MDANAGGELWVMDRHGELLRASSSFFVYLAASELAASCLRVWRDRLLAGYWQERRLHRSYGVRAETRHDKQSEDIEQDPVSRPKLEAEREGCRAADVVTKHGGSRYFSAFGFSGILAAHATR